MNNTLIEKQESERVIAIKEMLELNGFVDLNPKEINYFINICKHLNLDPFKKEIYAVPFTKKDGSRSVQPIVSYEKYLEVAYNTPRFYRYEKEIKGERLQDMSIDLKVYDINDKLMWSGNVKAMEFANVYKDYKTGTTKVSFSPMWNTKGAFMLEKCAIVRAARFVCPKEVGQLPYMREEMDNVQGFGVDKKKQLENYVETKNIKPLKKVSEVIND